MTDNLGTAPAVKTSSAKQLEQPPRGRFGEDCVINMAVKFNQLDTSLCRSNSIVKRLPRSGIIKRLPCLVYG
jgi:hypothetical protein